MAEHITLSTTVNSTPVDIQLPKDLEWSDEFSWAKITQAVSYGATGSLFIQEGTKQAGRHITLAGPPSMAWITREVGLQLLALTQTQGLLMVLTLGDDRTFNVMFRHSDGPLDIAPVKGFAGLDAGSWYEVSSIKLMEV